jgi:hypothetical protein
MMHGWLRISAMLSLVSAFAEARAQTLGANVVALASDHQPLGSPLVGWAISARTRGGDSSVALIVGAASLRGHADRFGIPCGGLIPPIAACAAQPLRDDGRVTAASIGAARPIVHARHIRLSVMGDVTLAQFHVESRAKAGGDALVAEKLMIGGYLGGEVAWYPSARWPLAIETSVAIGAFQPIVTVQAVDSYEPFDGGLGARRLRTGLSWRVR